ncbi:MAG TPA: HAD-IA family hydrolase [Steroidobacteraceae bacterium]|nr:HAD-IA family hydrolase [Steroidobacteraceae bacterium]
MSSGAGNAARAVPHAGDRPHVRGPRIEALIFDVDGTLADTEEAHRQAFNDAFRAHGLDFCWSRELYRELLQVTGGKERLAAFFYRARLTASDRILLSGLIPRLHATKTSFYRESMERGRVPLRSGVRRLMAEARAAGLRLAIASTTSPDNVSALLEGALGYGALNEFSVIATGDAVSRKKPAPDIYLLALSRLGVTARRAVAFEDSAIGVAAAKAAGLLTVATPSDWTREQDLAAADLVLPCLADPASPLEPADAWRIGAPYLGLEQLAIFHAATLPRFAHSA